MFDVLFRSHIRCMFSSFSPSGSLKNCANSFELVFLSVFISSANLSLCCLASARFKVTEDHSHQHWAPDLSEQCPFWHRRSLVLIGFEITVAFSFFVTSIIASSLSLISARLLFAQIIKCKTPSPTKILHSVKSNFCSRAGDLSTEHRQQLCGYS